MCAERSHWAIEEEVAGTEEQMCVSLQLSRNYRVDHGMDRRVGKDGHLARGQSGLDGARPVLEHHVCVRRAFHGDHKIARPRMEMGGQHGARPEVQHGHGETVRDACRKRRGIGVDHPARFERVLVLLREVEHPVGVLGQQEGLIERRVGHQELGDQIGVTVFVHGRHKPRPKGHGRQHEHEAVKHVRSQVMTLYCRPIQRDPWTCEMLRRGVSGSTVRFKLIAVQVLFL